MYNFASGVNFCGKKLWQEFINLRERFLRIGAKNRKDSKN